MGGVHASVTRYGFARGVSAPREDEREVSSGLKLVNKGENEMHVVGYGC